jgi:hypothetical protein
LIADESGFGIEKPVDTAPVKKEIEDEDEFEDDYD